MKHSNPRLRDCRWEVGYSSDNFDLIAAFYEPAMAAAIRYDRAVGYFSSSALALISAGVQNLYLRNGQMRLIASPVMSVNDRKAIRDGYSKRYELIEMRLLEYLDPTRLSQDESYRLQLLSGMIADKLLDVRIAVKEEESGSIGLYHEKVGVFTDAEDDFMTFIGSPNESWNGWVGNAESFALHTSWSTGSENARWERSLFERTWNSERRRVPVMGVPQAVREALFERFPPRDPDTPANQSRLRHIRDRVATRIRIPDWLDNGKRLHEFQKQAVNAWLESQGRGVFAMATGTGKTITALVAATQLIQEYTSRDHPLLVIVVVPTSDLVRQWQVVAESFNFLPICCHNLTASYWPQHLLSVFAGMQSSDGEHAIQMAIVTADTLVTARFQEVLRAYHKDALVIGDEVHSLGTRRRLEALPQARFRIGLSATPRRHGDEAGTEQLLSYFGPILQRIDIKQAIDLNALVPYSYDPIVVHLDTAEMEHYQVLSARIAAALGMSPDYDAFLDRAGSLLTERARLLGHAQAKLPALRRIMQPLAMEKYSLVYVAEGTHPVYGTRQLDEVVSLLGDTLGIRLNIYTSDTAADDRVEYQSMLRDGRLQALVAMRCLDEGVDIPEVRRGIILASTQNPRQFVQRRGRLLRRDDRGGKTHAELYDLIVVPPEPPKPNDPLFSLERRLVGRELTRSLELASASSNWRELPPPVVVETMKQYDLLELLVDYFDPVYWDSESEGIYDDRGDQA